MSELMDKNCIKCPLSFHIPRWKELPPIDLYIDQAVSFINGNLGGLFEATGGAALTKSMINNYVKAKIVDAPIKKKYPKLSVAMIVVVYLLKTCYSTEEIGKLIKLGITLGITLEDTSITYDRFCSAMENALNAVFSGKVEISDTAIPGRDNKYLMENFALSFACKMYVKRIFLCDPRECTPKKL